MIALLALSGFLAPAFVGCHTLGADGYSRREKSVRPGINENYKDANVAEWLGRFEVESREIYKHRLQIVETVGAKSGTVMADIGAGTGFFTVLFARQVGEGGKVFAVDITPEFLEHIAGRVREQGLTNVETVRCKEDSIELPPASIDLAFLCDTYHHFEYPRSTMSSIYRALKPGGELVMIDFERIPDVSREWVLNHVRAGKHMVTQDVLASGFKLVSDNSRLPYLDENYFLRFRKPRNAVARPAPDYQTEGS